MPGFLVTVSYKKHFQIINQYLYIRLFFVVASIKPGMNELLQIKEHLNIY